jgi:hypothetical protein
VPLVITEIAESARRHRISDERMQYVVLNCPKVIEIPSVTMPEGRVVLFLGFDQYGNRLEVMARLRGDELALFHADKARAKFKKRFKEVWGYW